MRAAFIFFFPETERFFFFFYFTKIISPLSFPPPFFPSIKIQRVHDRRESPSYLYKSSQPCTIKLIFFSRETRCLACCVKDVEDGVFELGSLPGTKEAPLCSSVYQPTRCVALGGLFSVPGDHPAFLRTTALPFS